MSGPGAGHQYPSYDVSWLKRDLLLFANSIGCTVDELHFLYELHPDFSAFPTYPILLPFKHTDQEVVDFYGRSGASPIPGVPKFDSKRILDGERHIFFYKPIPTTSEGRKFEIRSKVLGVYDKGKPGSVIESEAVLVDKETGEEYARTVGSGFAVGQGGWGGPKGPKNPSYNPPAGKQPDEIYELQTNKETAHLYRLNGDYNPLHADAEVGRKANFAGTIMHGLFSWNSTARGILAKLGGSDPKNIKEYQARFASPVIPGDKLTTYIWRMGNKDADGFEEVRFVVKVGDRLVLSNGRAIIKIVGSKSKL